MLIWNGLRNIVSDRGGRICMWNEDIGKWHIGNLALLFFQLNRIGQMPRLKTGFNRMDWDNRMTFLDCVCGGCILLAATHCDPNNLSMLLANPCKTVRIRYRPSSSVPPPWQLKAHHTRPARKEMNIQILRVNICRWALFNALILKAAVTL